MKKVIRFLGVVGLAMVMSFGFTSVPASALSPTSVGISDDVTNENNPMAASREASHVEVYYSSNATVPSTYRYNKYGYTGTLQLKRIVRDHVYNTTTATYAGTVYCSGVCMMESETK